MCFNWLICNVFHVVVAGRGVTPRATVCRDPPYLIYIGVLSVVLPVEGTAEVILLFVVLAYD